MPRSILCLSSSFLLALSLGCDRHRDTQAPAGAAAGAEAEGEAETSAVVELLEALVPPSVDLGPADPELEPLVAVEAVAYELPGQSRRYLVGRSGSKAAWPKNAGKGGKLMVAIDSPYQLFARDTTYIHVAAWKRNGRPASGASVYVGKREVGRTDHTGTLVFRHDQPKGGDASRYDMQSISVIDAAGRCGDVEFSPYERTPSFAADNLFVYTDRGIYRPGETIHVRGIGWRLSDDYAPLAGANIEVQLRDASGYTIAGASPVSDADGVIALDLVLPPTAGEGLYELRVAYGQERALGRVQVRNFEAPAITIEHDLGRFLTRDADELSFSLSLALVTGESVNKATLALAALSASNEVLFEREIDLAGAGPHAIRLSDEELASLRASIGEDQFGIIRMQVTDDAGRRDELQREIRVTQNPYVAVLELDKDQYGTGEEVSIVARITDRDRVPTRDTPSSVEVVAADGTRSLLSTRSDNKGTATVSFAMPAQGGVVELHLPEIDAPVASASLPWVASRPMQSKLDEVVVSEREMAKIRVKFPSGYRPADNWVHVDVVDTSGALVNAALLEVSQEQGEWVARGEFEAPTWGSMLLTLFALGKRDQGQPGAGEYGLLTEGQNLVVHPNKELEITLKGFTGQAKPGQTLSVDAQVRDPSGALVDASVGVSLVDAAVIDLKDPLEITPMDRFYNPELRTLSTTGSKILTWPVVSRNWGAGQLDIALPPFNYMDGGEVNACGAGGMGMGGGGIGVSSHGVGSLGTKKSEKTTSSYDFEESNIDDGLIAPSGASLGAMPAQEPLAQEPPPPPAGAGAGQGRGPGAGQATAPPRATITVRTQLAEVSLWSPRMHSKAGKLQIHATLPETIGEQELILVASDARGGVGVHRERVRVTQPVHVRAELPARLIAGERFELPVTVNNATDARHEFLVELNGLGTHSAKLSVQDHASGVVALPLAATNPGRVQLGVRAKGGGHDDREIRELLVEARGVPISQLQHGTLTATSKLGFAFELADTANDASLKVRFPTISAAMFDLDHLEATLRDDPDAVAIDLVSTALVLNWARRNQQQSPQLERLRERALGDISLLRVYQRADGAFGYWRNGEASPFVTGWALEGLLEARDAGLPEATDAIQRAASFIVSSIAADGLVDVSDIGWWEGETDAVRLGLTAELYATLARVPETQQSHPVKTALQTMDKLFIDYFGGTKLDPLTAGRAVQGLTRRKAYSSKRSRELVRQLLSSRNDAHWEPSWFHAYGGRIEVSVALLEVMHEIDPAAFATEIRDTVAWVLSTREAWGVWHNERGTASALRAILRTEVAPAEVASTVEVWLDGQLFESVAIDPADPYLSSLALADLGLGQNLAAGKHKLELRYDGKLSPAVELETRSWDSGKTPKARSGKAGKPDTVSLSASANANVGVGAKLDLRVSFDGPKRSGGTVVVAASNLVEVDLAGLRAWVGPGRKLRSARLVEGRLELELSPSTQALSFDVPLRAIRRGEGHLPSVAWLPRSGSKADALVVDPGSLSID